MQFGLTFKCGGETAQIRVTDTMQMQFRVTKGGDWQAWKRADVERAADGSLAEAVMECVTAQQAIKLRVPMKITFTGDTTGDVTFDGSGNVSCKLTASDALNKTIKKIASDVVSAEFYKHNQSFHNSGGDNGSYN